MGGIKCSQIKANISPGSPTFAVIKGTAYYEFILSGPITQTEKQKNSSDNKYSPKNLHIEMPLQNTVSVSPTYGDENTFPACYLDVIFTANVYPLNLPSKTQLRLNIFLKHWLIEIVIAGIVLLCRLIHLREDYLWKRQNKKEMNHF